MRADALLLERRMAATRSAARRLIEAGHVRWRLGGGDWQTTDKAGRSLAPGCELDVVDDAELRWVSRGGLKLEGALDRTGLDPSGALCLDVGQSTGGFTDVLLARGAARVVGIDVGHGQLHAALRGDRRVVCVEGVNARALDASSPPAALREPADAVRPLRFDLVVADLSFISLGLVLPALAPFAGRDLLLLVKPQFELQPADIGKGGLVRDAAAYPRVEARLRDAAAAAGLAVVDWFDSPIAGGDGNREFFLHARAARRP